jgi:hypothetical protein
MAGILPPTPARFCHLPVLPTGPAPRDHQKFNLVTVFLRVKFYERDSALSYTSAVVSLIAPPSQNREEHPIDMKTHKKMRVIF